MASEETTRELLNAAENSYRAASANREATIRMAYCGGWTALMIAKQIDAHPDLISQIVQQIEQERTPWNAY